MKTGHWHHDDGYDNGWRNDWQSGEFWERGKDWSASKNWQQHEGQSESTRHHDASASDNTWQNDDDKILAGEGGKDSQDDSSWKGKKDWKRHRYSPHSKDWQSHKKWRTYEGWNEEGKRWHELGADQPGESSQSALNLSGHLPPLPPTPPKTAVSQELQATQERSDVQGIGGRMARGSVPVERTVVCQSCMRSFCCPFCFP